MKGEQPEEQPLTLAVFTGVLLPRAYVQLELFGDPLGEMPLFLDEESYVNVPLEQSYQRAYESVARRWRKVIEAPPEADVRVQRSI